MKRLAYILYVAAVLLISGLARAHADIMPLFLGSTQSVNAHIDLISISDKSPFQIMVQGQLPNPCFGRPAIKIKSAMGDPNILILEVTSAVPARGTMCPEHVVKFSEVADVSTLVEAAQITIDEKQSYLIRSDSYPFQVSAQGTDLIKK